MPAQANPQMQMHADPVRIELAELAALAEIASDDESHEIVPAPQGIVSPRHAGSACSTCSSPAQAAQPTPQMQMHAVPVQCGTHLTAASPYSSISLLELSSFGAEASDLHFLFARLFTPKHPSTLPKSQWLSYTRLFSTVQPYAPARVWKQGPGNLKQLVIEWCKHHPAYAGLTVSAWCMRQTDDDQLVLPGQRQPTVYKFCLEYTP